MNEGWAAPPELTGATPRKVKYTQRGKVNLGVFGFALVFGFLIVAGLFGSYIGDQQLKTDAKETVGSVTKKWTQSGRSTTVYHYVAYSFTVEGQTFRGESNLPNSKWQPLSVGASLGVRYVPSNPSNNAADNAYESPSMPYWVPLAALPVWVWFVYLSVYQVRREKWLLQYGQTTAAVITSDNRGKSIPKYGWVTRYEFQLPEGSMRKGSVQRDGTWMRGQTVCILFNPKRPRISGIYPLQMCEIVT
jgi:hypothetical protein